MLTKSSIGNKDEATHNTHILLYEQRVYQVSMQDPVGVKVVYSIQDLEQQWLDHAVRHLDGRLLARLDGPVVLDDMLEGEGGREI